MLERIVCGRIVFVIAAITAPGAWWIHACATASQEAGCGNGRLDPGEECDDGNQSNNDGCTRFCRLSVCGDRIIDKSEEQCDDGNGEGGDGCSSNCLREGATCGDGVVERDIPYPEECDDGNVLPHDGCSERCFDETPVCGDGFVMGDEECDDGNRLPGDGCDERCLIETGDGDAVPDAEVRDAPDAEVRDGPDAEIGDADADTDAADVEGWDCVAPPSGCDLAPQCGCPYGEKCTLVGPVRRCMAAGFLSEGAACTADVECAAGLMCVNGVRSDVTMCYRFCGGDDECLGPGSLCLVTVSIGSTVIPDVTLCTINCNPVSSFGCPADTGCKIWQDPGSGHYLTDCSGEIGVGRAGAPCRGGGDCAPGFFCALPSPAQCIRFCQLPEGYCEGGYMCQHFATPVWIGGTEYGYCF